MSDGKLQVVTFAQAKRLKVAGFDWDWYDYVYSDVGKLASIFCGVYGIPAPTVALALKWARDIKDLSGSLFFCRMEKFRWWFEFSAIRGSRATFEEAESALLDAVLDEIEKEARNE